jgi:hypothetical protein
MAKARTQAERRQAWEKRVLILEPLPLPRAWSLLGPEYAEERRLRAEALMRELTVSGAEAAT